METKVYKNKDGHFEVVIYDNINYEVYEMMTPGAMNGLNMCIDVGPADRMPAIDGEEVSMEELMQSDNLDLRTAIKNRQEGFYLFSA